MDIFRPDTNTEVRVLMVMVHYYREIFCKDLMYWPL